MDQPSSRRGARPISGATRRLSGHSLEFVAVELRHNIVDIEDYSGAGGLRIPGSENKKVGHVMDMENIVGLAKMLPCNPPR